MADLEVTGRSSGPHSKQGVGIQYQPSCEDFDKRHDNALQLVFLQMENPR
jgi:hypothetical protein